MENQRSSTTILRRLQTLLRIQSESAIAIVREKLTEGSLIANFKNPFRIYFTKSPFESQRSRLFFRLVQAARHRMAFILHAVWIGAFEIRTSGSVA